MRTAPGILLLRSGKSLNAIDAVDGNQLWSFPRIDTSRGFVDSPRGKNVLEVPGMGIVLMNRVELPGFTEGRLAALNLTSGEKLWDQPQLDDLVTAIPLRESHEVILISRRLQRKVLAEEVVVKAGVAAVEPFIALIPTPYPVRFEIERLEAVTGTVRWTAEYPHTVVTGVQSPQVAGQHVFVTAGDKLLGSMEVSSGKCNWDSDPKMPHTFGPPPILAGIDDLLIYGGKELQAIDENTGKVIWETRSLGRITGISVRDGVVFAIGHKGIASLDPKHGTENWRVITSGYTTNLLWDQSSGRLVYADEKGIHSVEGATGKPAMAGPFKDDFHAHEIHWGSPETVVLIGLEEVRVYSLKSGKKVFAEGQLAALFRAYPFPAHWPQPEDGQDLVGDVFDGPSAAAWQASREGTLLAPEVISRFAEYPAKADGLKDAYETQTTKGYVRSGRWMKQQIAKWSST